MTTLTGLTEQPRISNLPFAYHGGKFQLAKWVHDNAPPLDSYTHRIIVFAGGLGELWNWEHEGIAEVVNDIDHDIANFYKVLRDPELFSKMQMELELTPYGNQSFEFALHRRTYAPPCPATAASFFTRFRMSRQGSGQSYSTPSKRIRRGMCEAVSKYLSAVEGLPDCHERLRTVEVRNEGFERILKEYDHAKAFFYMDPPYLDETRVAKNVYKFEMDRQAHVDMLDALAGIKGRFLLSGYDSQLYESYRTNLGWNRIEKQVKARSSSGKTHPGRVECIWRNF